MANPAQAVVEQIMRYFTEHPQAADSLEGVARWRLLQQRVEETVVETEAALEWLVARGVLQRVDIAAGQPLYRLANEVRP